MIARDLMTQDPETLSPDDDVIEAARLMRDLDVGLIPVVEKGAQAVLRGVITDRDIVVRHVAEGHENGCTLEDHMSAGNVVSVRPETELSDVKKRMADAQVRRILVVDEDENLLGIIAQADLAIDADAEDVVEAVSQPGEPRR